MTQLSKSLQKTAGLIPVWIIATTILFFSCRPSNEIFEPHLLLAFLNTIFLAALPVAVSVFAAKAFLRYKSANILMLGAGLLSLAWASLIAGWMMGLPGSPNHTVTVHNLGALMGGIFHLLGSLSLCLGIPWKKVGNKPPFFLAGLYLLIVVFISALAAASLANLTPPFFISGEGPTPLRQSVLGTATIFYGLSALIFFRTYKRSENLFFYWYSLGLLLIALGLIALFLQKSVGCPIGWAGRAAQYVGGFYFILAVQTITASSKEKSLAAEQALFFLFNAAGHNYKSLLESIRDAVICIDRENRVFFCNTQTGALLSCPPAEIIGRNFLALFALEQDRLAIQRFMSADEGQVNFGFTETLITQNNGNQVPVEYHLSRMKPVGGEAITAVIRNISPRKELETRLQESENKFRSMFERHDAIMLLVDPADGRIIDANNAAARFYGYCHAKLCEMSIHQINTLPNAQISEQMHLATIEARNYFIFRHRLADGDIRTVEVHTTPIEVDNKKIIFSIIHDISERVRAKQALQKAHDELEERVRLRTNELTMINDHLENEIQVRRQIELSLRRREEKFRTLFDNMAQGAFYQAADGSLLEVNESALKMFGLTREKFLARNSFDPAWQVLNEDGSLLSPAEHPSMVALQTGKPVRNKTVAALNPETQEYTWLIVNALPQFDNGKDKPPQVFVTMHDITARKKGEKELAEAKEHYRLLTEISPSGIWKADAAGHNTYVSPRWCEITGIAAKDATGLGWSNNIHPDDRDRIFSGWLDSPGQVRTHKSEFRLVRPDGAVKWVLCLATAIKNQDKISGWIGTITDITEHKIAEDAVFQSKCELERRVAARTLELQKTHDQLLHAEKLSAIGRLSASIAHEFNNPLQGVMTIVKGIKRRVVLDQDEAKLVDLAVTECARMRDLIKNLQDFNRPTSGVKIPMDIHAALDSLLLLWKKGHSTRKITIVKKYAEPLPQIHAVADQIRQVLLNLINNAVDACEGTDGGGTITLETEALADKIVIRVRDSGIGIRPEDKDHLFEPFFTTKPQIKGTGLGLSISYGIIKKHGGEITVDSEPGQGSTFSVILPIAIVGGDNEQEKNTAG